MPAGYARVTGLGEVLARTRERAARTMIFDVEPLVAWWDSGQDSLDRGITRILAELDDVPSVRAVVFATNSDRRPSTMPSVPAVRLMYLASAGKPLRTAPYQGLPAPGVVVGDQVPTDGLLAYRLGYTFLLWSPPLTGVPLGPRLLHLAGLARPLLFTRDEHRPVP